MGKSRLGHMAGVVVWGGAMYNRVLALSRPSILVLALSWLLRIVGSDEFVSSIVIGWACRSDKLSCSSSISREELHCTNIEVSFIGEIHCLLLESPLMKRTGYWGRCHIPFPWTIHFQERHHAAQIADFGPHSVGAKHEIKE